MCPAAPHEDYLALGRDSDVRQESYRELFASELSEENLSLFRKAAHYSQPVGDDRFRAQIEFKYGVKLRQMAIGRLRKAKGDESDKE